MIILKEDLEVCIECKGPEYEEINLSGEPSTYIKIKKASCTICISIFGRRSYIVYNPNTDTKESKVFEWFNKIPTAVYTNYFSNYDYP